MENILVTGGAGYIGSHACKLLFQWGYCPVTFDNMAYGHEWAVKWGPLAVGDINDRKRLDEVIKIYRPAAVMHFAAYAYVGESVHDPGKYYRNNLAGTLTLLEVMVDHKIDKIVFSSSCATYGIPTTSKIDENHPQIPISPYGSSKLMVEKMLKDFDTAYGTKSITLRYFNAAGADPDGEVGESHEPETHLIPLILDVAAGKTSQLVVYGDDYGTKDGSCIRDYIHVTDLAEAHILALQYLSGFKVSNVFNLGNGSGYSVKEVIRAAEIVTGKRIPFIVGSKRDGDPSRLVGDSTKATRELCWQPKYGELNKILDTAWLWRKKSLDFKLK